MPWSWTDALIKGLSKLNDLWSSDVAINVNVLQGGNDYILPGHLLSRATDYECLIVALPVVITQRVEIHLSWTRPWVFRLAHCVGPLLSFIKTPELRVVCANHVCVFLGWHSDSIVNAQVGWDLLFPWTDVCGILDTKAICLQHFQNRFLHRAGSKIMGYPS